MSSKELLAHLQNGAKLRTRWRYGKCTHELTLVGGTKINIQHSAIHGLFKAHKIHSIDLTGGNLDYYLEGQNWYENVV